MSGFLTGLLICLIGTATVVWAKNLNDFLPFSYGQKIFGTGASGYQVVGVVIILIGFFVMFGFFS